jgi:hypothetical protein
MNLTEAELKFLSANHSAAMITVGADGVAKVARVGVALMEEFVAQMKAEQRLIYEFEPQRSYGLH